MRAIDVLLVGFILFFTVAIFVMHNAFSSTAPHSSDVREQHAVLMRLITQHNETMNDLLMQQSLRSKSSDEIVSVVKSKDSEILSLTATVAEQQKLLADKAAEISRLQTALATQGSRQPGGPAERPLSLPLPMTSLEQSCDDRYGNGLLHKWRASRQTWCDSAEGWAAAAPSSATPTTKSTRSSTAAAQIFFAKRRICS